MTVRLEDSIPDALGGERLDRTVALLADLSRSAVARLIGEGAVVIGQGLLISIVMSA